MAKFFDKIKVSKPKRSTFDLSHDVKLSLKMGKLIPVYTQECVPGDKFYGSTEALFRMMPMLAPIMHQVDITFHTFFVPNRILWKNWEKFITGGESGTDSPAVPYMNFSDITVTPSSLHDYLGLPARTDGAVHGDLVNALPYAAYQKIYHEFYRDQNLDVSEFPDLPDGEVTGTDRLKLIQLRTRCWEHDYFTSCLPFAQKGDAVNLPIAFGTGDVTLKDNFKNFHQLGVDQTGTPQLNKGFATDPTTGEVVMGDGTYTPMWLDPNGSLEVDGQDLATVPTINEMREAFSLQRWLEKNARAGSRYIESILAHFGVRSSDKRLQRPEYLGGSKATMAISEVLQTSSTDVTTPQANMAGHGISISGGKSFDYYCEEHGFIMTILSIMPKTAYMQGVPKLFSKINSRLQYYWPDFAFLGEEEVLNKEVYHDPTDGLNEDVFGYLPRYSDYRYNSSRCAGQFKTSLDFWHLGRKFDNRPHLNLGFVGCVPSKRIFAVIDPDEDEIIAHVFVKVIAQRPIPFYGTPGSI